MELIETLKEAQSEIRDLRRRNEVLAAKVEVMDNFMQVLNTAPFCRTQGMSPDVAYKMGQIIMELKQTQAAAQEPETEAKSPVNLKGSGRFG